MSTKRKRVSKKTKSSWRKFVDINDVEQFLEDQRLEERLGLQVSTLSNDDLFKVDIIPSTNKAPLTIKQQKRLRITQSKPKCFATLENQSKIPDPITKRNKVRTKEERKNLLVKIKEENRRLHGILKANEIQSFKDQKMDQEKRKRRKRSTEFDVDIWNNDEVALDVNSNEWITDATKRHSLKGIGKLRKRILKPPNKERTVLPSVEVPHPGTSYNPSYADHQSLLSEVVNKERNLMKEEAHLNRVTKYMFKKFAPHKKNNLWMMEMSEGITDKENADAQQDDNTEYRAINPPVKNKKKTLQQRNKQKKLLKLQKAMNTAKQEKKKVADIYKLGFLKKQIESDEEKTKMLQNKRKKVVELKLKEAKRLNSVKFEEPDVDFSTGKELSGSLRNLKKCGNLLEDRFKSLQKRNILEPRVKQKKIRAKVKRYVRPGHKDDWKTTVAKV